MLKIYLDTCAWGRPFDDQTETNISEGTSAFFGITLGIDHGDLEVIGSDVVLAELRDISDETKRDKIRSLALRSVSHSVALEEGIKSLAELVEKRKKLNVDAAYQKFLKRIKKA
jgi:hypothetical protein